MRLLIFLCVCAIYIISPGISKVMPDYLPKPCSKSRPDYNNCMFKYLQTLAPYFMDGIPELNFPKMSPHAIDEFIVNTTFRQFEPFSLILKNVVFYGYPSSRLDKFSFDPETLTGEALLHIDKLLMVTEFDFSSPLLRNSPLHLHSSGYAKGNYTNVNLAFEYALKPIEKMGEKFYTFSTFNANGTIAEGSLRMKTDVPAVQSVADLAGRYHNEHFGQMLDIMRQEYEECVKMHFMTLSQRILDAVPANELLPE